MKQTAASTVIALSCLLVLAAAYAGDEAETVTLEGKMVCAKCTLGMEDAKDCQNVLVVEADKEADPAYYYLVDNQVVEDYGHLCGGAKGAVVTGTLEERDGKMWMTASKMMAPEEA